MLFIKFPKTLTLFIKFNQIYQNVIYQIYQNAIYQIYQTKIITIKEKKNENKNKNNKKKKKKKKKKKRFLSNLPKLEMCQDDTDAPTLGHRHPHAGILQKIAIRRGRKSPDRTANGPLFFNLGHQRCNFIKGYTCLTLQWVITPQLWIRHKTLKP